MPQAWFSPAVRRSNPTAVASAAGAMCVASSPEPSAPSTLAPKHQPRPGVERAGELPARGDAGRSSEVRRRRRQHERIEPASGRRGQERERRRRQPWRWRWRDARVHRAAHPAPTLRPAPAQSPPSATSRSPLTRAVAVGKVAPSSSSSARRAAPQKKTGPAPSAASPTTPVSVLPAIAGEPAVAADVDEPERGERRAVERDHAVTARAPPRAQPRRADRPADDARRAVGRPVLEIELDERAEAAERNAAPSETCSPQDRASTSRAGARPIPPAARSPIGGPGRPAPAHDDGRWPAGRGRASSVRSRRGRRGGLGPFEQSLRPRGQEELRDEERDRAIAARLGGTEDHLAPQSAVQDRILGGHLQAARRRRRARRRSVLGPGAGVDEGELDRQQPFDLAAVDVGAAGDVHLDGRRGGARPAARPEHGEARHEGAQRRRAGGGPAPAAAGQRRASSRMAAA